MTDIEALIARLEGLMAKATTGPWLQQQIPPDPEFDDAGIAIIGLRLNDDGEPMFTPTNGLVAIACQSPVEIDERAFTRALANADLIEGSVNALPTLIAHIKALSGAVEAERERCAKIADQTEPLESEKIGSFEALITFYYGRECVATAIRSSLKEGL